MQKKQGETDVGVMRRIGHRHAIVLPARRAELVDINDVEVELARTVEIIGAAKLQLAKLDQRRQQLEARLAEFKAAPIDRVEGDPTVPLEPPSPAAAPTPAPNDTPPPTVPSGKS